MAKPLVLADKYNALISELQSLLIELREEETTALEMENHGMHQGLSYARVMLEIKLDSLQINRPRTLNCTQCSPQGMTHAASNN